MTQPIPLHQIEDEGALLRALADAPPWAESAAKPRGNRGLGAAFRRWSPAEGAPALAMLDAVFEAALRREWFGRLGQDEQDAAAARVAAALHLFALGPREPSGPVAQSFGSACGRDAGKGPVVSNGRFARTVNAPPDPALRLQAVGRAFRHVGAAGVRVAGSDAPNLLRFLFSAEPEPAVARWAGDYFRTRPIVDAAAPGEAAADVPAPPPTA